MGRGIRWGVLVVLVTSGGCAVRPPEMHPPAQPPALELRIADVVPRLGWVLFENEISGSPLYLDPAQVIGSRDLAAAGATETPEGLRLDLWLTDEGSARLAHATGENVGRWLAVVANGQVRSAFPVGQQISARGVPVQFAVRLDRLSARRLQEQIQAMWPPPS